MLEEDPYHPRPGCDIRLVKGHRQVRAVRGGDTAGSMKSLRWRRRSGSRNSGLDAPCMA